MNLAWLGMLLGKAGVVSTPADRMYDLDAVGLAQFLLDVGRARHDFAVKLNRQAFISHFELHQQFAYGYCISAGFGIAVNVNLHACNNCSEQWVSMPRRQGYRFASMVCEYASAMLRQVYSGAHPLMGWRTFAKLSNLKAIV